MKKRTKKLLSIKSATARQKFFASFFQKISACLTFLLLSGSAHATTLYDQLGGARGVARISDSAVDTYMTDPRLHAYFDNINPYWLKRRFTVFICHVTDGGCLYRGRTMANSHRGLHIDEAAFNVVVEDLQAAMRQSGVGFRTQNRLLARLAPMERDIVTR